jgi:hypothetical protein
VFIVLGAFIYIISIILFLSVAVEKGVVDVSLTLFLLTIMPIFNTIYVIANFKELQIDNPIHKDIETIKKLFLRNEEIQER